MDKNIETIKSFFTDYVRRHLPDAKCMVFENIFSPHELCTIEVTIPECRKPKIHSCQVFSDGEIPAATSSFEYVLTPEKRRAYTISRNLIFQVSDEVASRIKPIDLHLIKALPTWRRWLRSIKLWFLRLIGRSPQSAPPDPVRSREEVTQEVWQEYLTLIAKDLVGALAHD